MQYIAIKKTHTTVMRSIYVRMCMYSVVHARGMTSFNCLHIGGNAFIMFAYWGVNTKKRC